MSFVSYAQNFEDVMLWRALKEVEQGFYIDVGANEPAANSVSKAFYDRGWRGINIEPLPQLWADLERERLRDINLQCAVGEFCGETDLWEPEIHGWATVDPQVVAMHQKEGVEGVWRKVPLLTLTEICRTHVKGEVHFLKIDVEGYERSVLAGMDFSLIRPWIVVVEATLPNSTVENHQDWEPLLLSNDYIPVYADGLNRFYLAREKEDLQGYFRYPPNVLDDFILYRQVLVEQHMCDLDNRLAQADNRAWQAEVRAQQAEDWAWQAEASAQELLSQTLEAAQARIRQNEQAAREAQAKAHEAQMLIKAIHASTSWRVTRPLRGVIRVLRGDFSPFSVMSGAIRRHLPSAAPAATRPRLAYISPLPPERSGISDYSAELLPFLSRWYDIEVIVDQTAVADAWINQNCPVRDVAWFRAHAKQFDRVLYHFGNSSFHQHMFALLEEIPGVVVLHDFFLSGIQAYRALHDGPHLWELALQASHGYRALVLNHQDKGAAITEYPANLPVLQAARGVIVHSEFSRRLANHWYGGEAARDWAVLPLVRGTVDHVGRRSARQALQLAADRFLVCAFGVLGPIKQNELLLEAWLASPLAKDERAMLVFVGENDQGNYGLELSRKIRECGMGGRVQITGWTDAATFRHYLAAADIGVQLRTQSRGETSAAVLDCLNHGLATIVNAHGSMADLDREALWMLPDAFSNQELTEALTALWRDPARRKLLGKNGRAMVAGNHAPEPCAERYFEAIESSYRAGATGWIGLLPALSSVFGAAGKGERPVLAAILGRMFPPTPRRRQLLVDVSAMVHTDLKTGIQRVVRAVLSEWLAYAQAEWQVEPVYATPKGYRYARRYTCRFLGIPDNHMEDTPIEAWPGDVFFGLDLHNTAIPEKKALLRRLKNFGVKVGFLVYDLLPVTHPDYFPLGTSTLHTHWLETITAGNLAVCISAATADELRNWLAARSPENTLQIEYAHIGADVAASVPTAGLPADAEERLQFLQAGTSFLMVGTVEPRKGHAEVLAAFERLWAAGIDINLVIVGKRGWLVDDLAKHIYASAEYEKRLFWLEGISDEYLEKIYAVSDCLIAASEAEGFGLPLIEAARHYLPVIARDIPVFREVAGTHASYFSDDLAKTLENWLAAYHRGEHIRSDNMPWLSWQKSARQLWDFVTCT